MPTTYYTVHGGRLSLGEYWRMSPDPFTFLIAAGMKLFGGVSFAITVPRHEELFLVEFDELPGAARRLVRPGVEALEAAGLRLLFCHELDLLEAHRYGAGVVLLAPDGRSFAAVNHAREGKARKVEVSLVSSFRDDTFGVTTTAKKQFRPHPDYLIDRHPGAPADELYDWHQRNLDRWEGDGKEPVRHTPELVARLVLEGEQRFVDFHAGRGVFVPMKKSEVRRLREQSEGGDDEEE